MVIRRGKALLLMLQDRWPAMLLAVLAAWVLTTAANWALTAQFHAIDDDEFFSYERVEFAQKDRDTLLMLSTGTWKRPGGPVVWHDVLRCKPVTDDTTPPDRWAIWDYQITSTPNVRAVGPEPRTTEWPFHGTLQKPPPVGRDCYMRSVIAVTYDRSWVFGSTSRVVIEEIESDLFMPGAASR